MLSISSDLYNRLQTVVLRCGPLNNDRELRALFNDARISIWRDLLPEAHSRYERTNVLIDTLGNRYNRKHENALVLWLQVLRDQTPTKDTCHQQLDALADELENILTGTSPQLIPPERLRPYLPFKLYNEFLHKPDDAKIIQQCISHLTALLDTVQTYCAAPILSEARAAPEHVQGHWCEATLLFADISGFTKLSEQLKLRGRAGAEEITQIVNRYFTKMVQILQANGGALLKFGGDALLGMFVEPPGETARYAVQAALDMQRAMVQFADIDTSIGHVKLQMKVGIHTGQVFTAHVGTATQMEYWVLGEDVNIAARAEEMTSAGQVIVSEATKQHLTDWKISAPIPTEDTEAEPFYVLPTTPWYKKLRSRSDVQPFTLPESLPDIVARLDKLTPYLPHGVLKRLIHNPHRQEVEGEHRLVAVLFVNVRGFSALAKALSDQPDTLLATLQDYFATMQSIVERHGGVINKTDLYSTGDKLLMIFGAPVAHEDDTDQAARAALAMQAAMVGINQRLADRCPGVDVQLSQRIGLSTGYAFSGNVGSDIAQEYTIMGDEVNLAARLMSAAQWGEIWVSSHIYHWLVPFGKFSPIGVLTFKGKEEPMDVYQLQHIEEVYRPRTTFMNRIETKETVENHLKELLDGQGSIIALTGEPGIGKSRLWEEALKAPQGVLYLTGCCSEQQSPYQLWAEIVRAYLELEPIDEAAIQRDVLIRSVERAFGPDQVEDRAPFLSNMLGLPPLNDLWREKLKLLKEPPPPQKPQLNARIAQEVADFIERLTEDQPVVLICEDLHWLNDESAQVLEQVMDLVVYAPLLLGFTRRPGPCPPYTPIAGLLNTDLNQWSEQIRLQPLGLEDTLNILETLPGLSISQEYWERIYQKSGGNPLFLAEIARATSPEDIPHPVQKIIEGRVDALEEGERRILKSAAVAGSEFKLEELDYILDEPERDIRHGLANLRQMHLIGRQGKRYHFIHDLVREVVYKGQNLAAQHAYHRQLGAYYEGLTDTKRAAEHYTAGELWHKALEQSERAADQYRERYVHQTAVQLYEQAIHAAQELKDEAAQARLYRRLGRIYYISSEYALAQQMYQRELGYLLITSGDELEQAGVYLALGRVYDRWSQYARALHELDRGLVLAGEADSVTRAQLLNARCSVLINSNLDAAEAAGLEALHIAERLDARAEEAYACNNLGAVYGRQRQFEKARIFSERSLELRRELGVLYDIEQSLVNLGSILSELQELNASADCFQQALELQEKIGDRRGQSSTWQNLGLLRAFQGDFDVAEHAFLEALSFAEKIDYQRGVALSHHNLGQEVYLPQKRWQDAVTQLEKSLALYMEMEAYNYVPENYYSLARAYQGMKQTGKAISMAEHARDWARETGDARTEAIAVALLDKLGKDVG